MCNECSCQCANQKEKLLKMASQYDKATVYMSQATYEAMTGDVLMIGKVKVEIRQSMHDATFLVEGVEDATQS